MKSSGVLNRVVTAAVGSYEALDFGPVTKIEYNDQNTCNFYLPKIRRIEKVWGSTDEVKEQDIKLLDLYRENGIEVWVLVPLNSMGQAHQFFRGRADRIQAWWADSESHGIKFGNPETP